MTTAAPAEAPASPMVRLWCGTCRTYVPIRPTWVSYAKRRATVQHVTPAAWTDHRATHTTTTEGAT